MDAIACIKTRRSVRSYKTGEIARETIENIIQCAALAASAINIQPVHFVVVQDKETREKIAGICDYGKFIAHASACVVVLSEDVKYYLEDASAATQNLLLAANALGLATCWVAGDKKPYAAEVARLLNPPPDYKLISIVALGYGASEQPMPEKKPLENLLHWEKF